MKSFISFEVGGTNIRFGIVREDLKLMSFDRLPTDRLSKAQNKISFFSSIIRDLIKKSTVKNITAVTFALASLMDRDRTYIYSSPMIDGFDNIAFKSELEKEFSFPVILEKDVNILLLYEIYKNKLPLKGIITGFFLGTGVGNSISIDGKIYVGNSGAACELGHIPLYSNTEFCKCGKKGCVETKASGRVLEQFASDFFHCPIKEIFKLHGESPEIVEVIECFATAIATEIGIIDPYCIILGGGLINMENFPKELLISRIKSHLRIPYPRDSLEFLFASSDAEAGVIGAVIHAQNILH
ncbi:allose kinase [Treponema parvum]|uniref:allose kinase n=1 Tax=Treponema parvum TaxID=138851 RepID=UPI001AEBE5A1|nr:allose kinase [Treponema parvum]QTQ15391.1 allose kinase [Treponema parvum]